MASPVGYAAPKHLQADDDSEFVTGEAGKILDPSAPGGSASPVTLGFNEGHPNSTQLANTDERVPMAPVIEAEATSDTVINISWADVDHEEEYVIERSANGTSGWTEITNSPAGADGTNVDDEGRTAETEYFYRVKATNTNGDSAYSAVASATTDAAP